MFFYSIPKMFKNELDEQLLNDRNKIIRKIESLEFNPFKDKVLLEDIEIKPWVTGKNSRNFFSDTLFFDKADALHIKMKVKYTDYKVGRSEVRILDDAPDAKPTPSPTPKKPE